MVVRSARFLRYPVIIRIRGSPIKISASSKNIFFHLFCVVFRPHVFGMRAVGFLSRKSQRIAAQLTARTNKPTANKIGILFVTVAIKVPAVKFAASIVSTTITRPITPMMRPMITPIIILFFQLFFFGVCVFRPVQRGVAVIYIT